jgi:hypothetical protein
VSLLDRDPVFWRELHLRQPSGWGRAIWRLYVVVSVIFTMLAIFANRDIAPGTSAFMVWRQGNADTAELALSVWISLAMATAYAILRITIAAFDRLVGRMPAVRAALSDDPSPRSLAMGQPRQVHQWPS